MEATALVNELDFHLDVFGQQPIGIYTQICFCFPMTDASLQSTAINTLTNGLERLSASFPWIAGKVVNEGASEGNTGLFKIKGLEKIPRLVVKDLRNDPTIPTMNALRQKQFPCYMLDEDIFAPCKTIPDGSDKLAFDSPVFLLQANFIVGGLILTFNAHHGVMDMTGQGQIIDLFSKACCDQPFTSAELSSGNLDRRNIITFLDDSYQPGPEIAHLIAKPAPSNPSSKETTGDSTSAPPKCTWNYFSFSSNSLAALKSLATKTLTLPSSYISTDDTLTAFIWQSVMRARLPRLSATTESTLARAVDGRRYLDIPLSYTGFIQNMSYHKYSIQKLTEEQLGGIASQLRSAVDPQTSQFGYSTRAFATFLNRSPDRSKISVTATIDSSVDIMLSSWAKIDCYDLDFNLGFGKPECVRRPRFVSVESLIYLMPKAPDGEIAVEICLRDEDMYRLRTDPEFAKYGKYIG